MPADTASIESDVFALQPNESGTDLKHHLHFLKQLFVLLQQTLVNYSACVNFLTTDIGNYTQFGLELPTPAAHVFGDITELLTSIHNAHDTIKGVYDFMEPNATHMQMTQEYLNARALFVPFSQDISRALSKFEGAMVDEVTHTPGDYRALASSTNLCAVLGCAMLRPLARACCIIDASVESLDLLCATFDGRKELSDATNEACCVHMYLFCRHFQARVMDICGGADYRMLQQPAMHLRLEILALVVRGFDPEDDRKEGAMWEQAPRNGCTTPTASPTSTILVNSRNCINVTLEASIPYARPNLADDGEDAYDNTILREILMNEGTTNTHIDHESGNTHINGDTSSTRAIQAKSGTKLDKDGDRSETCMLGLLESLVFFLDMVPVLMRLSQRLYRFRGERSMPKMWEILTETASRLRAGLVSGGSACLVNGAPVREMADCLRSLVGCLTLAVTNNKWPPSVAAGPVLDGFLELSVALELYLDFVSIELKNDTVGDAWEDFESSARAAMFEVYDMRYQIMYDLTCAPQL